MDADLRNVLDAMINRFHDGTFAWFNLSPCGGNRVATREEAENDFLEWARKHAKKQRSKCDVVSPADTITITRCGFCGAVLPDHYSNCKHFKHG